MALGEILNETVGSWTDLFDLHNLIDLLEALLEVDLYGRLVDDVLQGMYFHYGNIGYGVLSAGIQN